MKKCKLVNIIIVVLILIANIICAIYSINNNEIKRLSNNIVLALVLLFPPIIEKILKIKFKWYIKTVIYIFIILSQLMGCVLNLYRTINWFDNFVHGLSGTLTAIGSILFLTIILNNKNLNKWFILIYLLGCVTLIAVTWEIIEYGSDVLFKTDLQYYRESGVNDTMQDMTSAIIGGLLIIIPYIIEKPNGILHKQMHKIKVLE